MSSSDDPWTDESDADDSEWRFGLDEVGPDADPDPEYEREPLEPGSPSLENVAFVLLGVVGTLLLFLTAI